MKPKQCFLYVIAGLIMLLAIEKPAIAQSQYKLKQVTNVMNMKSESTIYVKGKRKRTENSGIMGIGASTTVEQCDLQRTITLNDKRKLYHIQPFSTEREEIIDEDAKPAAAKPKPAVTTKKGGTITMYHSIIDTGERKKMYGVTARRVWTTMKIKPSADACTMKDSMIMKTDGWYIDLPEFICPVRYAGYADGGGQYKPDCKDNFVTRRSGKGKLGFALVEKRTMIMGDGKGQTTEFVTDIETIEFSTAKLDSMLFEIPPGYTEVKDVAELQDKPSMSAMKEQYKNNSNYGNPSMSQPATADNKKTNVIRVGIFEPAGEGSFPNPALQQHLLSLVRSGTVESVAVSSEGEARDLKCDYVLNTNFTRVKQASKVGGLIKAIKNTDPNASSSFNIDATLILKKLADGSTQQEKVSGKYDGGAEQAAKKALDEGAGLIVDDLK